MAHYTGWLKTSVGKGKQFDTSRGWLSCISRHSNLLSPQQGDQGLGRGCRKDAIGETALLTCTAMYATGETVRDLSLRMPI